MKCEIDDLSMLVTIPVFCGNSHDSVVQVQHRLNIILITLNNNKWFKKSKWVIDSLGIIFPLFWPLLNTYWSSVFKVIAFPTGSETDTINSKRKDFLLESLTLIKHKFWLQKRGSIHHWPFPSILFTQFEAPFQTRWWYLLIRCRDEKVCGGKGFIFPVRCRVKHNNKKR